MSLPYDATPPPSPPRPPATEVMEVDSDPLDRPLDDYKPAVPDHVQSLMGRMSKGKVYLLEETPAILHMGAEERVRRDPRIAALSSQLDEHDPTEWLDVVSSAGPSKIRHNALFVRSDLIKHLSTSKVFSWVTSLGSSVMGIEWLNDTTLNLLFPSPAAALLALSLMSKAGFDPSEGDDPLLERAAHGVPVSLLPQADLDPEDSKAGEELLGESGVGGVRRRGRGGTNGSGLFSDSAESRLASGSTTAAELNLAEGVDPNSRVTIRFAIESDKDLRREAKQSEWYARHGRRAGKEVASTTRASPYSRQEERGWTGGDAQDMAGQGRDLGRRIGRGRGGGRREGDRARGGRTAADLDRELDGIRGGAAQTGDAGGGRRPRRGRDDLDKELDDMFAARGSAAA